MLFADIDKLAESVLAKYDHSLLISSQDSLNDELATITNYDNEPFRKVVMNEETSAENLAKQLYCELVDAGMDELIEVRLSETDSSVVIFDQRDYEVECSGEL